eukprot:TRINITY_DN2393_c0_g1_i1.p1 TRINITY_DN2393_c0_g1~~TRINITY_DN2393_c0_g1_i1.p1  ORF type:complete len:604 (-),score=169.74 TRINITY_DN2393_c0_g1_i1:78-1889(-)
MDTPPTFDDEFSFTSKKLLTKRKYDEISKCFEIMDNLNNNISELYQLKINAVKNGYDENFKKKARVLRTAGKIEIIELKTKNRSAHMKFLDNRNIQQDDKKKVFENNLEYENLIYQERNLMKEIEEVKDFKSRHTELNNLITAEELPENLITDNKHKLMLNRLTYDLEERKRLVNVRKELSERKEKLLKENEQKEKFVKSLAPLVQNIKKSIAPINNHIIISTDVNKRVGKHKITSASSSIADNNTQLEIAQYLPAPLYMLYYNASTFLDSFNSIKSVVIQSVKNGVEKARSLILNNMISKKDDVFEVHPLSIDISCDIDDTYNILIRFHYMIKLKIVTITIYKVLKNNNTINITEWFDNLYPNDIAEFSPNPKNYNVLDDLKYPCDRDDRPYKWVQRLCGLTFLPLRNNNNNNSGFQVKMPQISPKVQFSDVIDRIFKRFETQEVLSKQCRQLKKLKLPSKISKLSKKPISSITLFAKSSVKAFEQNDPSIDLSLWEKKNATCYKIQIKKQSKKITAYILIPIDYPTNLPIFSIENKQNVSSSSSSSSSSSYPPAVSQLMQHKPENNNELYNNTHKAIEIDLNLIDSNESFQDKLFIIFINS